MLGNMKSMVIPVAVFESLAKNLEKIQDELEIE